MNMKFFESFTLIEQHSPFQSRPLSNIKSIYIGFNKFDTSTEFFFLKKRMNFSNQSKPLTITDLLQNSQFQPSALQPPHQVPQAGHRRIIISNPQLANNIPMSGGHTSLSAYNLKMMSPNQLDMAPDFESGKRNIPLFINSARQIGSSLPAFNVRHPIQDMSFDEVCNDKSITLNPKKLNFIPTSSWTNEPMTFGVLVGSFFRKRNSTHCKFPYKLYNALQIAENMPEFIPHIGVQWATDSIIKVDREPFARLIGVKTIEGGLFHQQGNFPSHGFMELSFKESDALSRKLNFGPADLSVVRYVQHMNGKFVRGCTEEDLDGCKWTNTSPSY